MSAKFRIDLTGNLIVIKHHNNHTYQFLLQIDIRIIMHCRLSNIICLSAGGSSANVSQSQVANDGRKRDRRRDACFEML